MKYFFILISLTFFTFSCSNKKEKIKTDLRKQEQELTKSFDKTKADQLITSYKNYIQTYPEDTSNKSYMMNATEFCILNNDADGAIGFIDQFLKKYPDDSRAPLMQFKKAIVFDLLKHDMLRSIAEYDIFLKTYPKHPLCEDARNAILLLQNLKGFR
jgi:outer membrane protein assembly factor BamD (BamD/ComL family)